MINQTLVLYFSTDAVPQFIKKLSHSFFFKLFNHDEKLFVNCSQGVRVCACARAWVCMFVRKMIVAGILRALIRLYYIVRFSVHVLFNILTYNVMYGYYEWRKQI